MKSVKYILVVLVGFITSFFYFPTIFVYFPYQNTKNILAVVGCVLFALFAANKANAKIGKEMFLTTIFAFVFSLICFISIVYNCTPDYTYATYFISMWIWLAAAYAICFLIKKLHGHCSLQLLVNYLVGVCVSQCIVALWIDNSQSFADLVNSIFLQDEEFFDEIDRLYGIGAALDVAGIRFAVVLVLLSHFLIYSNYKEDKLKIFLYASSFFVITVIGDMISRTTIVGAGLGLLYMLFVHFVRTHDKKSTGYIWLWIVGVGLLLIPIVVYYYNTDTVFRSNTRFAFEGFFSLIEKGYWQTDSNDKLKSMVVWPDNMKTWIIGDGYFGNPTKIDPYVVANIVGNFYMGTDVGYCRFIFYCGVIGLLAFSAFLTKVAFLCIDKHPKYRILILLVLVLNFVVWVKVATDIFLAFALLLCMDEDVDEEYMKSIALEEDVV